MAWWIWFIIIMVVLGGLKSIWDSLFGDEGEGESRYDDEDLEDYKYFQCCDLNYNLDMPLEVLNKSYKVISKTAWKKLSDSEKDLYDPLYSRDEAEEKPEDLKPLIRWRKLIEDEEMQVDEKRKKLLAHLKRSPIIVDEYYGEYDKEEWIELDEDDNGNEVETLTKTIDEYYTDIANEYMTKFQQT